MGGKGNVYMKIILPDTSIMLASCDRIQSICQWMFDQLNFNHFDYGHYYDNGKTFHLTNDRCSGYGQASLKSYYAEEIYITFNELDSLSRKWSNPNDYLFGFLTPELAFTDELPERLKYRKQMEILANYSIYRRIYFFSYQKDHFEVVGFGCNSREDNFHSICIQNLPILRSFITYFRHQAKDIIEAAEQQAVYTLPIDMCNKPSLHIHQDFIGYDFFNKKKLQLRLTNQEAACLTKLAQGKSFKETARLLTLSPRTVESYLHNIKNKMGCDSTSELLNIFCNLTHT